jgi:hypothetical protein
MTTFGGVPQQTGTRRWRPIARVVATLAASLTLVAASAASANAQPEPLCGSTLRVCISDIAYGSLYNAATNHEQGGTNCNFYSGYWGNSGDDACGWQNGFYFRSNEWCADFARYTWYSAGANVSGLDPWAGSFYRANKSNGHYHPKSSGYIPARGDAVLFDWDGTTASLGTNGWDIDHVGIVIEAVSGWQNSIDGNWGNNVAWVGRNTSRVVGFVSPRPA